MKIGKNSSKLEKLDCVTHNNFIKDDGSIDRLNRITMELTYRCNLNCKMCFLHGVNGVMEEDEVVYGNELTTKQFKSCIDDISKTYPSMPITITGGEPFVRRDCMEICRHIVKVGSPLTIISNGTLINEEEIEEISKFPKCNVIFSLDGTEEIHDFVRGKGNFKKTVNNIKRLKQLNRNMQLQFNFTISSLNYKNIFEFAKMCDSIGVNASFEHLWFTDEKLNNENEEIVKKMTGEVGSNKLAGFINNYNDIDIKELKNQIAKVITTKFTNSKFAFFPLVLFDELDDYYNNLHGYVHNSQCYYHFEKARVNPQGDVIPCIGESVGNVTQKSINDIINSTGYKNFRKAIKKVGILPNCRRCCKL